MPKNEGTEKYTVARRIDRGEEKQYIEIPFRMPEHAEKLSVEMKVDAARPADCTIDLGLSNATRVVGWSGGARSRFFVGREKATPGYLPCELAPGDWAVLLGAYRVPDEGCIVTIRFEISLERYRWLKGDLHTHTEHSDGTFTLTEAVKIMESTGCDFLATTDHNAVSQNFSHPKDTDLVLIPGCELTTNRGHANLLGAADPLSDFRAIETRHIRERFAEARRSGARIVINHPFHETCAWEWDFDIGYDWVEIWNGPWRERNRKAVDWWQRQLAAGRKLIAVGGSDVHVPGPHIRHAYPTTWVYAASRTARGVLDGIGRGNVFISQSPEGPTVSMFVDDSHSMGDTVNIAGRDAGTVYIDLESERVRPGDSVKFISEQGTEAEIEIDREGSFRYRLAALGRKFYRVEIWRRSDDTAESEPAAIGNPVYFAYSPVLRS